MVQEARTEWRLRQRRTVLFVDEIHRFNKAQQDAFLPARREWNSDSGGRHDRESFLRGHSPAALPQQGPGAQGAGRTASPDLAGERALKADRGLGSLEPGGGGGMSAAPSPASPTGMRVSALNSLELAAQLVRRSAPEDEVITRKIVGEALQKRTLRYDKSGEEHFNLISALHKSLRNSDPDAALLYWMGRMLEAGEDPLYIARRMVRFRFGGRRSGRSGRARTRHRRHAGRSFHRPSRRQARVGPVGRLSGSGPQVESNLRRLFARSRAMSPAPATNLFRCTCGTLPPA